MINKKNIVFFIFILLFFNFKTALSHQLNEAPLIKSKGHINGVVRVHLKSLSDINKVSLQINGNYKINEYSFNNENIELFVNNGLIELKTKTGDIKKYTEISLIRASVSNQNYLKISASKYNENSYPCDLRISIDKTKSDFHALKIVAYIFIEEYLYGVVPYEIGENEHIEALKAQAIAARTYTVNKMNVRKNNFYDVSDTISDQVYYGTNEKYKNCKLAVDSTWGIVLTNKGKLTDTLYTASNGGQTESAYNVWKSVGYDYLMVKDDPYDLENTSSAVKSISINKNLDNNVKLYNSLYNKVSFILNQNNIYQNNLIINKINSIYLNTPKYDYPSRLYTKAFFDLNVSYINANNNINSDFTVSYDIFKELEQLLNLSISTLDNELWYVEETTCSFIVKARRYGHGIGMSQRGAMQMGKLGYNYAQVLAFYYKDCVRLQNEFSNNLLSSNSIEVNNNSNNLMIDDNFSYAYVNTVSGSLNLRLFPNKNSEIIYRIPKGEKVKLVEFDNEWSKVFYNNLEGYVMTSFLLINDTVVQESTNNVYYAFVNTNYNGLNMRTNPNYSAAIIAVIPQGSKIEILNKLDGWCKIKYNNLIGYVNNNFLLFDSEELDSTTINNETFIQGIALSKGEDIPLYFSNNISSKILYYIKNNTKVFVSAYSDAWYKVKYKDKILFAKKENIIFKPNTNNSSLTTPDVDSIYLEPTLKIVENGGGTIYSQYDSNFVDVYNQCIEKDKYIAETIPNNTPINIFKVGKFWSEIEYEGKIYYCLNKNIAFN